MTQAELLRYIAETLDARRQRLPLASGATAWFASPEDVILYKLLYYREGGSGMHLCDILGMLRVSGSEIDQQYLRTGRTASGGA